MSTSLAAAGVFLCGILKYMEESGMSDQRITPFIFDRVCNPAPSIPQLVLKDVDSVESVYSRNLHKLYDASLPHGYIVHRSQEGPDLEESHPLDLFVMEKYRQDWTPSGYGLGELVFSISLAPNEEVTLEIKTWETDKRIAEDERTLEDRQLTDVKSTASAGSEARNEESAKTHEYVDAKGSYSGFGVNVSVAGGWSEDLGNSQSKLAKQTEEQSKQATNERKGTSKVKIAVSRESGSESKTTRRIRNVNQAHTLNLNYYQILQEYQVKLVRYDVSLVILGAEPLLNETYLGNDSCQYTDPDAAEPLGRVPPLLPTISTHSWITLGQLIEKCRSSQWVQDFTKRHGKSPIRIIREMWAAPLWDAAMSQSDYNSGQYISDEERVEFRDTMLRYTRPSPGWIETDEAGALRWAYEILPEKDSPFLTYLYQFLPYSPQQLVGRAVAAGADPWTAKAALATRYANAIPVKYHGTMQWQGSPQMRKQLVEWNAYHRSEKRGISPADQLGDWLAAEAEIAQAFAPISLSSSDKVLARGVFYQKNLAELNQHINEVVSNIADQLRKWRPTAGPTGLPAECEVRDWKITLPTSSVYADASLGVCSGAEDYFEIQRQFDLELKQLEIEKLRLQVEKLALENKVLEQGGAPSSVVIKNPTDQTAINLGLTVGTPAEVDIQTNSP
ncbi:hypothetical protein H3V53_36540 [Paraburkholderia bengalensis]|uniref:Uncharacterized protein n=1 Tax=Paraburkholderia bengalensis TaxID=2747562 RepID=A0ABU8J3Z5_9BURK